MRAAREFITILVEAHTDPVWGDDERETTIIQIK